MGRMGKDVDGGILVLHKRRFIHKIRSVHRTSFDHSNLYTLYTIHRCQFGQLLLIYSAFPSTNDRPFHCTETLVVDLSKIQITNTLANG